jgi:alpha-N-acetylglucosaminidase
MLLSRLVLVLLLLPAGAVSVLDETTPRLIGEAPLDAIKGLLKRVLPGNDFDNFDVKLTTDTDGWELSSSTTANGGVRVMLAGSNGVAIGSALNHYLRNFALRSISWDGDNMAPLPSPLPPVKNSIKMARTSKWSYYANVCTVSYSMAWWDWARWERELDWMALSGINLPLAFTGQEYIYQQVLNQLGLKNSDLDSFFAGPALLAWYRMGNIRGVDGPLPQHFIEAQFVMQKKILSRAKALGMTPVLPAFTGFVPEALRRIYPDAKIATSTSWDNAFNTSFCCNYRVDVTDPLYMKLGKLYIDTQTKLLGSLADGLNVYSADQYNEMAPPFKETDLKGIANAGRVQIESMRSANPAAVWLVQGWTFLNSDVDFWHDPQSEAYFGAVPNDAMIVLGLAADLKPLWKETNSYYGKPFIWCMLHNFGGNIGLGGRAAAIMKDPVDALPANTKNSTMVGIGKLC